MTHGMSAHTPETRTLDQWRTRHMRGMTIESDIKYILRDWEKEQNRLVKVLRDKGVDPVRFLYGD